MRSAAKFVIAIAGAGVTLAVLNSPFRRIQQRTAAKITKIITTDTITVLPMTIEIDAPLAALRGFDAVAEGNSWVGTIVSLQGLSPKI
jgi:hypothetical protein